MSEKENQNQQKSSSFLNLNKDTINYLKYTGLVGGSVALLFISWYGYSKYYRK